MDWLWWLTLGALIGWLVEWIIDWLYWRRRFVSPQPAPAKISVDAATQAERDRLTADLRAAQSEHDRMDTALRSCRDRSDQLEQHVIALRQRVAALEPLETQLTQLRAEHARLRVGRETPLADVPAATLMAAAPLRDSEVASAPTVSDPAPAVARRDPLIDISGIGPVYEQMLFDAGVLTFAQLAAMAPEAVRAIIKPESWQNVNPEAWIADAGRFAEEMRAGTYRRGRPL